MRIPNVTSIFQDWTHQSFIDASLTSLGQENKVLFKNPSVLSDLVQIIGVSPVNYSDSDSDFCVLGRNVQILLDI